VIVLTNAGYAGAGDIADAAFDDLHPQLFASSSAGVSGENPAITAPWFWPSSCYCRCSCEPRSIAYALVNQRA
jgi:hypothetical protein